VISLRLSDLTQ